MCSFLASCASLDSPGLFLQGEVSLRLPCVSQAAVPVVECEWAVLATSLGGVGP